MKKKYYYGRRMVGEYDYETKTFYKEVSYSRHRHYTSDSWGVDAKAFNSLPNDCVIKIHDTDHNQTYVSSWLNFEAKKHYLHFKEEKKDHGTQVFLRLSDFRIENPKELTGDELAKQNYLKAYGY